MDIDSAQKTPPASARRRLLRGAFSAPAALALYSGRAMANASSLRCVKNAQGTVGPLPIVADSDTTYVRIGLYRLGTTGDYFVKGIDLGYFRAASQLDMSFPWPSSTQARQFDIGANGFASGSSNITEPADLATSPSQYAVLRIDGTGTVVGVGNSGLTGGSAIYKSCWTSFKIGGP